MLSFILRLGNTKFVEGPDGNAQLEDTKSIYDLAKVRSAAPPSGRASSVKGDKNIEIKIFFALLFFFFLPFVFFSKFFYKIKQIGLGSKIME